MAPNHDWHDLQADMAELRADLTTIARSLRMLPPWEDERWWSRWKQVNDAFSRPYLYEKLSLAADVLHPRSPRSDLIHSASQYVLFFFDIPELYEHLDAVAEWEPQPGRAGQRWSETICAAAWRVLIASRPDVGGFTAPDWGTPTSFVCQSPQDHGDGHGT
jgi:hypothetical protein